MTLSQAVLRKPDEEKPDESPVVPTAVNLDGEKGVKTLGVGWNPPTDVLSFAVKETNITKQTSHPIKYLEVVRPPWFSLSCHDKGKDSVAGHLASEGL